MVALVSNKVKHYLQLPLMIKFQDKYLQITNNFDME